MPNVENTTPRNFVMTWKRTIDDESKLNQSGEEDNDQLKK